MTQTDASAFFTHMEWADARIWSALAGIEPTRLDAAVQERLHHVHLVQHIYLQMWQGKPHEARAVSTFAGLDDLRAWAQEYYAALRRFVADIEAPRLDQPIVFPWADELVKWFGQARTATLHETMLQVAMHTTHHRGQLTTMIRERGGTPPPVDFIAWIWMGKPKPEWTNP